jgi:hypothetical protein
MLIDNLKDINSVADLFAYICKIEEENENLHKQVDSLLIQLDKATRPEVGFKIDYKDYNVNARKREL